MPPHDIWDLNPVFQLEFWASYSELLQRIGFREDPDNEGLMVFEFQEEGVPLEEVVVVEDILEADEDIDWEEMV